MGGVALQVPRAWHWRQSIGARHAGAALTALALIGGLLLAPGMAHRRAADLVKPRALLKASDQSGSSMTLAEAPTSLQDAVDRALKREAYAVTPAPRGTTLRAPNPAQAFRAPSSRGPGSGKPPTPPRAAGASG